jgi:hypothetical protein
MIKWSEKTVKGSALKPFERNPRKISEAHYERLKRSLKENGYHQRVLATKDLRILGGHQRLQIFKELGIKEIAVLTPNRNLTDQEFRRLLVQDNLPIGSWDFDILSADFEVDELINLGMPEKWLGLGEEEAPGAGSGEGKNEDDASRVVPCPKCGHEFSILTEKKAKKC